MTTVTTHGHTPERVGNARCGCCGRRTVVRVLRGGIRERGICRDCYGGKCRR